MSITIITPTFNAEKDIDQLIFSLENQTNKNFKWLVYDGCSTDNTLEKLKTVKLNVKIVREPDFGIFDALNKSIKKIDTTHYIFCGADDFLDSEAIDTYTHSIINFPESDIITAPVLIDGVITSKRNTPLIIGFQMTIISAHAVGCCIKKELHNKLGYYDKKYWACADASFIMNAYLSNAKFIYLNKCVGTYSTLGESVKYSVSAMCGIFRIQTEELGWNLPLCLLILNLKLIKFWIKKNINFIKNNTNKNLL